MSKKFKSDIAIIGAGPVGLFTVFQAGMLGMSCTVIDALSVVGGQCRAMYPEKPIYDIPAYPFIKADDLVVRLEEQAAPFNPQYLLGSRVEVLEKTNEAYRIVTLSGDEVECKVIIIAAGCGAFGPNRPPLAGIEQFEDRSVFYLVNNISQYRDKTIVIAGGGDSAVDWAVALAETAKKVYVVHRRDKFRAFDASVEKMYDLAKRGKIELIVPYQLKALEGSSGMLSAVVVESLEGEDKRLEADYLLPFFGLKMDLGPISQWNLNLEKNHLVVDRDNMETNQPGIFAVGDIATYAGKLKLILTGFAESAMACHHAYKYIFPDKALHFEYSTAKGAKMHLGE